jgi:MOSC domain-containing protein YiiM
MNVISVNVGRPREVRSDGKIVLTSIFKSPVDGRVAIRGCNLAGDQQSDPSVHGGPFKAVYAYPSEHYVFWGRRRPGVDLPWGVFGENLTIEGLLEPQIHVGDRLRIGSAELVVTQPRMPCYKLGIRFDDPQMVKAFLDSRRSGFYMSVAVEGEVGAGDAIEVLERHPAAVSIREILGLHQREERRPDRLQAAIDIPALSGAWRRELEERLRSA